MTTPIRPTKKALPVVLPQPKPVVAPQIRRPVDELSAGRALPLRTSAAVRLGTPALNPTTQAPAGGSGYRVSPLGALQPSAGVATLVSDDKREAAEAILSNYPPNPSGLANELREAADDPELRKALIADVFESGAAASWLNGEIFGTSRKGQVNEGYDDLTEVATAVSEAYRAGEVSDEDLRQLAEDLGPEQTAVLVQTLALGTNAGGVDGVVEALGEQAEALGYDEAAALAFTSTDVLLQKHYPTAEAQREAFGHVESFIERYDEDTDFLDRNPAVRNAVGSAVVNAARLTANGNGYTQEELDEELAELGPTLTGEVIAQAGERIYNDSADGPLDVLGDSAARIAERADGDDKESWEVNSAIAYTQSTALIEANLTTDEARSAAFDTLNGYLADSRDEWSLAERDGYSLVRAPQAVEGVNLLLGAHPEMITQMLDGGAQGEADLVQLYESISLVPGVPQQQRDQLQHTLETYVEDQLASVEPGNANEVGARLGRLFGTMQVAANRAVSGAEAEDSEVKELALDLVAGVAGAAAEVALEGVAGPLGAAIGGEVVSAVLGNIFEGDEPSKAELQDAFVDRLKEAGIDVSAGERGHDQIAEVFGDLEDAITAQLAPPNHPTDEEAAALQTQLNVVQGLLDGLDTFGDTLDSGEDAGELNVILNGRDDDA